MKPTIDSHINVKICNNLSASGKKLFFLIWPLLVSSGKKQQEPPPFVAEFSTN
jgi:hypothetical protein